MNHPPVMLVHGFLATPTLMRPMRGRIEASGRRVFSPALAPLAVQDVRALAGQLDVAIDRVRQATGVDRIDVVGASQGGIIALWWAQHRDGWARTHRMVAVGAPFRGTWAAAVGLPALGWCSRGIWQLVPGSALLAELGTVPAGARMSTIALDGDPVCPADRCQVDGADHRVFSAPFGPLKHQWMALSPMVARAVVDALDRA